MVEIMVDELCNKYRGYTVYFNYDSSTMVFQLLSNFHVAVLSQSFNETTHVTPLATFEDSQ